MVGGKSEDVGMCGTRVGRKPNTFLGGRGGGHDGREEGGVVEAEAEGVAGRAGDEDRDEE